MSIPEPTAGEPIRRFFDAELDAFRALLLLMADTATRQVRTAVKALVDNDAVQARKVVDADDEIDRLEVRIDEEAMRYMNLRGPVATELRLVIVGMKASHDLERVGDEATSIAKRVVRLSAEPQLEAVAEIARMSGLALEMLRDALDCFLHRDADKALEVCHRDAAVDRLNKQIYRDLTALTAGQPATTTRAIELMFVSKSIERVADHASNIAEEVIYLVQGRDVRHTDAVKKTPA